MGLNRCNVDGLVIAMMSEPHPDFRNAVRFPLHLPVTLLADSVEYPAETIDISAGGILFRTESEVAVGSVVEFTIAMPGQALGADRDILVKCRGRVVRSSNDAPTRSVAVVIDDYKFERL